MNSFFIDKNQLDELVFENRNKSYGAYALRRSYPDHLQKSTFFTLSFLVIAFLSAWLSSVVFRQEQGLPVAMVNKVFRETPVKLNNFEIVLEKAGALTTAAHVYRIVPDKHVAQRKTEAAVTNTVTSEVGSQTSDQNSGQGVAGAAGQQSLPLVPLAPNIVPTESLPEFPGGMDALNEFLYSNLRYPERAIENGVTGKVLVTFVIDENGKVTEAQVLRRVGFGCSEEALRVVESMPNWKPGLQNGRAVPVKMSLPVIFETQN